MSNNEVFAPFEIFPDIDGDPLESGFVYVGTAGLNPEVSPISVYWDRALTIPAAQPIRTIRGYLSRNGSPGRIYVNANSFSITVRNKNGSLVYSDLTVNRAIPYTDLTGVASVYTRVDSLNDLVQNEFEEDFIFVSSYYGSWAATVAGPTGGHYRHKTGANNTAPTVGSPVAVSTIGTGTQAGYCWDASGVEWKIGQTDLTYTPQMFGAYADGATDDTAAIADCLTIVSDLKGTTVLDGGTFITTGTMATGSGYEIRFGPSGVLKNESGTEADTLSVEGNNILVSHAKIDGNGTTMNINGGAYTGLFLRGYNNTAYKCEVYNCGKYETSGNMGGGTSTQQGIGSLSSNTELPNYIVDCVTYNNKNYGMSLRSGTVVRGGTTYDNGTNGIGARYSEEITIDGTKVGVQKQDNPDTSTNGIYFDTETSGANVGKNSRNIKLLNLTVEAQESFSLTSTRYTDMEITNCRFKGNIIIQSTKPTHADDTGTFGAVKLTDVRIDGTALYSGLQQVNLADVEHYATGTVEFDIDNCDSVKVNNILSKASQGRLIRNTRVTGKGYEGDGRLLINDNDYIDLEGIDLDAGTAVSDAQAITCTGSFGRLKGKIANYGIGINGTSGKMDVSGFRFDTVGQTDVTTQNACVRLQNADGWKVDDLHFTNCDYRLTWFSNCDSFSFCRGVVESDSAGSIAMTSNCDKYTMTGWTHDGTGDVNINTAASCNGDNINSNWFGASVTLTAYPEGATRINSGTLEVYNGTAWTTTY